jgi:hypothetical protein
MSSASRTESAQITEPVPSLLPEDVEVAGQPAPDTRAVSYLSLLLFYLPLGFSGLMMTLDLPVVNAIINRFPDANVQVAALRVAFSLALVYEATHISMIDISTTLSSDLRVFRMLRRFYLVLAVVLLAVAALIVFTPLYDFIVQDIMNIPPDVAHAARIASIVFLLWPIPIGWRRLHQGALIKHGHPKPVGAGGLVRLGSLAVALLFFGWLGTNVVPIEPAAIAVLAMLVSVTGEAAAVHGWTTSVLKTMPETTPDKPAPTYRELWRFVFPLSGTAIMSTLMNPVLTAGIASAAVAWASPGGSVVAVAAYAIAWSMAFLVFGPTLSMTQASIAWNGSADPRVRELGPRVLVGTGVVLGLLMAFTAFTPLAYWIFSTLLQAPEQTAAMAATVALFLVPMPILQSASFVLRGRLIARHEPKAVRRAQFIDLAALVLVVLLATASFSPIAGWLRGVPAAPAAAVAYNLMLCVDIGVLLFSLRGRR